MNTDLNKKGRLIYIFIFIFSFLLVLGGVFAIIFIHSSFMKDGPSLTAAQYAEPEKYLNIEIDQISSMIATSDQGKYSYFLIMDKDENINLYEVNAKEAEALGKKDLTSYKSNKNVKILSMSTMMLSALQKTIDPVDYELVNKETFLSNYEVEREKISFTIYGSIAILTGSLLLFYSGRTKRKNAETLEYFQEQYPQIRDIENLKEECDFANSFMSLYIKGDYIISLYRGFHIADLKNVILMYQFIQRYNLFFTNRFLYLRGYEGLNSLPIKGNKKEVEGGLEDLFEYIDINFPQILIGFDEENNKIYKETIKEYKDNGKKERY